MTVALTLHWPGELPALPRRGALAQAATALRGAAQWRLLLIWWLALLLPTLLVAVPVLSGLARQLNHALAGPALATGLNVPLLAEAVTGLQPLGVSAPQLGLAGLLLTLLLTPWLAGVAAVAARQQVVLPLGELLRGGLAQYARMGRLLVWGLVLTGIALALGGGLMKAAEHHALGQVLAADAERWETAARVMTVLLVLLAQCSVELARARLVLEPRRRSVVLAWWAALRQAGRLRGRGLWLFLGFTLLALLLLAVVQWARLLLPLALSSSWAVLLALAVGQLGVLAFAWLRCARLWALVDTGRMASA